MNVSTSKSAFIFLVRAHDYVWATRSFDPLARREAQAILWKAILSLDEGARVYAE